MPKLGLPLGVLTLLLTLACNDDGPSSDTANETEANGDGDGDGDGECPRPAGVFGDCVNNGLAACMTSGPHICVMDDPQMPSLGVCGRSCNNVCDCWEAPAGSAAPSACIALVPNADKTCVLDCSGGQACPAGMFCMEDLNICVFTTD
jgi:hypothetical protein